MDRNSCSGICTDVIYTLLLISPSEQSRITETQVYVGMRGLRGASSNDNHYLASKSRGRSSKKGLEQMS